MYKRSNGSLGLVVLYPVAIFMGLLVAPAIDSIAADGYMTAFEGAARSFGLVMLVVIATFAVVCAVDNRFAIVGWVLTRFRTRNGRK